MQPEIQQIRTILENLRFPLKAYLEEFLQGKIIDSRLRFLDINKNTQREILETKKLDSIAFPEQLKFFAANWDYIGSAKGYQDDFMGQFRDFIFATKTIRNGYTELGHLNFKEISRWDFLRAFDTLHRIAIEVNANPQIINQTKKNRGAQLRLIGEGLEDCWVFEPEKLNLTGCEVIIEEIKRAGWENDVLSVPVAKSFHLVDKFKIHSTPYKPKYKYTKTRYITFRNAKWEMLNLYEINKILKIKFSGEKDLGQLFEMGFAKAQQSLDENELNRLKKYCKALNFIENEVIYILSEPCVNLPHSPKPSTENLGPLYFSLDELKNGKKIVSPDLEL